MEGIRARLAAIVASALVAGLSSAGVQEIDPRVSAELEVWVSHTFELVLFMGYAVIHPWLQARAGGGDEKHRAFGA